MGHGQEYLVIVFTQVSIGTVAAYTHEIYEH